MATYGYEDFAVQFRRRGDRSYDVTARDRSGHEAHGSFELPLDRHLVHAVQVLGRTRDVGHGDQTVQERTAQEIGTELAGALLGGPVGNLFDGALRAADESGTGVRLRLSLGATPELLDVPWELLYRRPTFLASQRRTPIVRFLDLGATVPQQRIEGVVRILGVVANPQGLARLDVADERARLERALASMVRSGQVQLDWLDPATPQGLRRTLRDGNYHVLHFIGHGGRRDDESVLAFEDEHGAPAYVSHTVLVNLLGDQRSLCLAVLNSCRGARATLHDPFAGMATSLVALGVSAVVAMQFAISDDAAIAFAEELYTALIDRRMPVDAAVAEGRKAVLADVNEVEWATPVLFSQSRDGVLFDFASGEDVGAPPAPPRRQRRRVVAVAAGAVAAIAGAVALLLVPDWGGDDDPSSDTTQPGGVVGATPTSLGTFDLLPECPTAQAEEWTDLGLTGQADVGPEETRHTFDLDAAATRPGGTGDHQLLLALTVAVTPEYPSNPHQYWWQYELTVGAERLNPTCFSVVDANPIPSGGSSRVLVGFDPPTPTGSPGILLLEAGEGRGRIDLAAT